MRMREEWSLPDPGGELNPHGETSDLNVSRVFGPSDLKQHVAQEWWVSKVIGSANTRHRPPCRGQTRNPKHNCRHLEALPERFFNDSSSRVYIADALADGRARRYERTEEVKA